MWQNVTVCVGRRYALFPDVFAMKEDARKRLHSFGTTMQQLHFRSVQGRMQSSCNALLHEQSSSTLP